MNALAETAFTKKLNVLGSQWPVLDCILCISAHWQTSGTWVTGMSHPQTIHDFHGFPKELFDIQYPAAGSEKIAQRIQNLLSEFSVQIDKGSWGLDHGTWSVLKHLYPRANIPVVQLSLDKNKPDEFHYELGKKLQPLREENVLILGSGNVVHNLRQISWQSDAPVFPWASDFNAWVIDRLQKRAFNDLIHHYKDQPSGPISVPTPEHWQPLLYVLGATQENDSFRMEYNDIENSSISMLSFSFGQ